MKIFMDTANVEEIREFADMGIVYGVTTNPSLIAKSGRTQAEVIPEICALIPGREARELVKIAENVVVKIPCITEGLKAVKILAAEGIKTNVTLVFSLGQALLAARAGASYVSPFIGRLDDIGQDGSKLVEDMVKVFRNYQFKTEIIAASVRNMEHVDRMMLAGADIATIPTKVLRELIKHELTDKGLAKFMEDYQNSLKK